MRKDIEGENVMQTFFKGKVHPGTDVNVGRQIRTKDMTVMGALVAMTAVAAYIAFPLPFSGVPFTAQTLMINVIALTLQPFMAFLTVLVYVILGAVGVPILAGGSGGIGAVVGPSGGFLLAFLLAAPLMSFFKGKNRKFARYLTVAVCIGMPIIYLIGSLYMSFSTGMDLKAVLVAGVLPFIFGDLIKCVVASFLAVSLNRVIDIV